MRLLVIGHIAKLYNKIYKYNFLKKEKNEGFKLDTRIALILMKDTTMKKGKHILVIVLGVLVCFSLFFTGCNPGLNKAKKAVKQRLKDPYSAKFKNVHYDSECNRYEGLVNAKNGFGAYSGYEHFTVGELGLIVTIGRSNTQITCNRDQENLNKRQENLDYSKNEKEYKSLEERFSKMEPIITIDDSVSAGDSNKDK